MLGDQKVQYQFSYRLRGNQTQPKLFFLHGFMGCQDDFDVLITALVDQFHCLTVDLPGHGKTEALEPETGYDIHRIAAGLVELLYGLDFSPCHLVGYSMGGRLALYLACRFPAQFQSVLLESAAPGLASVQERIQRQQADEQLAIALEKEPWPSFLDPWYQQPIFANLRQHPHFAKLLHQRAQNSPVQLAYVLRGLGVGNQPSLWPELSSIKIPMGLVVGALDAKFVDINQKMLQCCQAAQLHIVPHCGHAVHFEQPQALAKILNRHIAWC